MEHEENTQIANAAARKERGATVKHVIVGTDSHPFQGNDPPWCSGVLGGHSGPVCMETEDHPIHTRHEEWLAANSSAKAIPDSGLKDSGVRIEFGSGMVRDAADSKPGFQYLFPKGVPMDAQMITRVAEHLRKGAVKYAPRNWEKGDSDEEAERARESALRHMMQYIMGETDEDHAAAVIINLIFAETMQFKADQKKEV